MSAHAKPPFIQSSGCYLDISSSKSSHMVCAYISGTGEKKNEISEREGKRNRENEEERERGRDREKEKA